MIKDITGLPETALASPMGQMLKNMIEKFESGMKSSAVPFVPWEEPSISSGITSYSVFDALGKSEVVFSLILLAVVPVKHHHFHASFDIKSLEDIPQHICCKRSLTDYASLLKTTPSLVGSDWTILVEDLTSISLGTKVSSKFSDVLESLRRKDLIFFLGLVRDMLASTNFVSKSFDSSFHENLVKTLPSIISSKDAVLYALSLGVIVNCSHIKSYSSFSTALTTIEFVASGLSSPIPLIHRLASQAACNISLQLPRDGSDGCVMLLSALVHECSQEKDSRTSKYLLLAILGMMYCNDECSALVPALEFQPSHEFLNAHIISDIRQLIL